MPNLNTIQQDIAELTPEAQHIVIDFIVTSLKSLKDDILQNQLKSK